MLVLAGVMRADLILPVRIHVGIAVDRLRAFARRARFDFTHDVGAGAAFQFGIFCRFGRFGSIFDLAFHEIFIAVSLTIHYGFSLAFFDPNCALMKSSASCESTPGSYCSESSTSSRTAPRGLLSFSVNAS